MTHGGVESNTTKKHEWKRGFSLNIWIQNGGFSNAMKHGGYKGYDQ